ncbi:DUF1616 domain-containing protein [Halobacterium zhouii]|uniref:DUF1616 domain-containing protein n=1 Tax=Halobacterium zhouii TaxID=2902624 RepID=UPI001E39E809|nr:DUF1616 domain-containing protein [Halobacterium zhouii]
MIRSRRDHPRWRTSLPLDVLTVAAIAVFVGLRPPGAVDALHVAVGLGFVFFAPGYAVLAALFPARRHASTDGSFPASGLGWVERAGLSVGASVALVPLVALAMAFAGAPFTAPSVRTWLVAVVLLAGAAAVVRRYALPPEERLVVPLAAWFTSLYDETVGASNRRDAALNIALAASVLLALGSVGFAVADAEQSDPYTEVVLLSENDAGELVAANYSTNYERGETHSYVVRVQNRRPAARSFTLVTELQRVRSTGDRSATVVESAVVSRRSVELGANETGDVDVSVTPSLVGDDLRLVTFLYEGDAPDDPSMSSASQSVFLWVDVAPSLGGEGSGTPRNETAMRHSAGDW